VSIVFCRYCFLIIIILRVGRRSRSLALVLKEVGFSPTLLQGGYKAYRRQVFDFYTQAPLQPDIIGNPTLGFSLVHIE
jgi:tRNA 2-selenouridine synthase SelU